MVVQVRCRNLGAEEYCAIEIALNTCLITVVRCLHAMSMNRTLLTPLMAVRPLLSHQPRGSVLRALGPQYFWIMQHILQR